MILSVFSSAILYYLAFPNVLNSDGFWFFGWVFALPLFFVLDRQGPRARFLTGFVFGCLAHALLLQWLTPVHFFGYLIFVLVLSLQPAVFSLGFIKIKNRLLDCVYVPALWAATEWLRTLALGGFCWSAGYSQGFHPELIQAASWTGPYGVSFVLVVVNYCLYRTMTDPAKRLEYWLGGLGVFCAVWVGGIEVMRGAVKLFSQTAARVDTVAVIQPNIDFVRKWDREYFDENVLKHVALTIAAMKSSAVDLVVWPETAFPDDLVTDAKWFPYLSELAAGIEADFLIGAVGRLNGRDANSAVWIGHDGKLKGMYHKQFLIPFWERAVFKKMLPRLNKHDLTAGKELGIFFPTLTGGKKYGVAICSEGSYPRLFRQLRRAQARAAVVLLNDGWFAEEAALKMHAQNEIFRAVETRLNVVRASNTGLTSVITPWGQLVRSPGLAPNTEGFGIFKILPLQKDSLYVQFGDLFAAGCAAFVIMALGLSYFKKNNEK